MPGRKPYATQRQVEVLTNPLRADIFQRIAALGPVAAPQIAESLSLSVTSLYHHLNALIAAGVVKQSKETTRSPGRPAALYSANKRWMYLSSTIDLPKRRKQMAEIVRASARQAAKDFKDALNDPTTLFEGKRKNAAYFRSAFVASEADLARINELLEELRNAALTQGGRGQLLTITWFMSPPRRSKQR